MDVWIQNAGPSSNHHCKDSWRCQRNINGEILWSLTGIPSWLMVSHESVMKTWCVTYSCTASHGCGHFQKLRPWTEVRLARVILISSAKVVYRLSLIWESDFIFWVNKGKAHFPLWVRKDDQYLDNGGNYIELLLIYWQLFLQNLT